MVTTAVILNSSVIAETNADIIHGLKYRGADKSLARHTYQCIFFIEYFAWC
jgi:hypothetical protein